MNFYIKILISLLFFFPNIVSASDISRGFSNFIKSQMQNPQNKDKIVNLSMLLVKNKKIYFDKNKEPFSGIGVKFYKNGQLMTMLKINSGSLIKQDWTCFYENGKFKYQIEEIDFSLIETNDLNLIKSCTNNPKNKKNGIEKIFYPNGEIKKRNVYRNKVLIREKTSSDIKKERKKRLSNAIQDIMSGNTKELTLDEINTLRNHVKKCWKPPYTKMNSTLSIDIKIQASPQGEVISSEITNKKMYLKNKNFSIVADSALRAINRCSPLPLPLDKYDTWKTFIFNFNTLY